MLTLASTVDLSHAALICTAIVSVGVVLAALRIMAADIDYARRCEALLQQARTLRERQAERLRSLKPRR